MTLRGVLVGLVAEAGCGDIGDAKRADGDLEPPPAFVQIGIAAHQWRQALTHALWGCGLLAEERDAETGAACPFEKSRVMAKKPIVDPHDGLTVSEVGKWALEKHARVKAYIEIASATRAKYVPPPAWHAGASYIELFSGPGRSLIRRTKQIIDGSPLVAYKAAQASGVPFTQIHLNDFDAANSAAVDARIRALGGAPICYSDPADVAVDKIVAAVNPRGLHFAFLDPYNLEGLSFDIIRKLSKLKVDMLIHVSVHDLQRNLDKYSKAGGVFDIFAPQWSDQVDPKQAINSFRAALMKYWLGEIHKLGKMPAKGVELIVGSKRQRLYWLVFVSGHGLAQKFWNAIRDPMKQTTMNF